MTDYKGKVIDTCSDCGKRGPMWSGMPYLCKGCSEQKMNKSNDIFEKAWFSINKGKKGSKPDYLDFDEDGDKKEPMKNALKNKKVEKGMGGMANMSAGGCSVCKGGALPCIGRNVMTSNGVMCNNQVLDMTMG